MAMLWLNAGELVLCDDGALAYQDDCPCPEPCTYCESGTTPAERKVTTGGFTNYNGTFCSALNREWTLRGDAYPNPPTDCTWRETFWATEYIETALVYWIEKVGTSIVINVQLIIYPSVYHQASFQKIIPDVDAIDCETGGAIPLVGCNDPPSYCHCGSATCEET